MFETSEETPPMPNELFGVDSVGANSPALNCRRDDFLRSAGFRVLRFWNADVLARTDQVVETIFEALHRPEMDGRL